MIDYNTFPDVDIYEQDLNGGKLYILRGGWTSPTPRSYMDEVVRQFIGTQVYNQFIEIHLDVPQVRVILMGINDLRYEEVIEYYQNRGIISK